MTSINPASPTGAAPSAASLTAPTQFTPAPTPPSPRSAPVPKFGLAWRIFLGTALVVLVVLVVTLVVASTVASSNADAAIQAGLEQTDGRITETLLQERAGMLKSAKLFAEAPSFRSAVDAGPKGVRDTATVLDQASQAAQSLEATWAQITDAEGTRLAKSDDPDAPHASLASSALIAAALDGKDTSGFAVSGDTALALAVALPIQGAGGAMSGVLMAVRAIDNALAKTIGSQTGTDLIFYIAPPRGAPKITISPPKLGSVSDLSSTIESAMMGPASVQHNALSSAMMMAMGERKEISIAGTRYVGERVAALSASGNEVGGFIALRDKDKELAGFYKLRNALLLAGVGGLLLAFLLSLLISRQIVRPVQALVGATQRAADGDYNAEIPVTSRDEIGTLAEAFKRLLADLRDKQALVDFLQSPTSGRTVALKSVTPTMAMEAMGTMAAVLEPGQTLAVRYEIKSVLGVGGMGMVYKAADKELGEVVAIKTLKADLMEQDTTALDRFKTEIKLARRIAHRNVVRTYDLGESGGVYFITMEFVEGKSLKELIMSRGRLPVSVTLPIAKQLCRALEVAHEEGVIHRDIKPQNMVVQPDGVLKVMDFGIARLAERKPDGGYTQAGMIVGTPDYMAPEQLFGEEIDVRADLYAAGVVIYECLTGKLPHQADTPMSLIAKVLEETPRTPRELEADVPGPLSDIVMRTLSRERDKRPRSALELHDWLEQLDGGGRPDARRTTAAARL